MNYNFKSQYFEFDQNNFRRSHCLPVYSFSWNIKETIYVLFYRKIQRWIFFFFLLERTYKTTETIYKLLGLIS